MIAHKQIFYVSTISYVLYKAGEKSFESDIEPDNYGVLFELAPLAYTHNNVSIFHMCLVCMFTIIVVAMSQQRSAVLYPWFILIRCQSRPVDLKRSESRRWLPDSNGSPRASFACELSRIGFYICPLTRWHGIYFVLLFFSYNVSWNIVTKTIVILILMIDLVTNLKLIFLIIIIFNNYNNHF